MNVKPASSDDIRSIREKANVIRRALMGSRIPPSPVSMSQWTLALMLVAGELIEVAPPEYRGNIIDEMQAALLRFSTGSTI